MASADAKGMNLQGGRLVQPQNTRVWKIGLEFAIAFPRAKGSNLEIGVANYRLALAKPAQLGQFAAGGASAIYQVRNGERYLLELRNKIMKNTLLSEKPWLNDNKPLALNFPKGMLGTEERAMLFYLTKYVYSGRGNIVDAGAFAGCSAFCLAAGLSQSDYRSSAFAKIHSYDLFSAMDQYVADAITANFKPISLGGNYFDVFQYQTGQYKDFIRAYPGDFSLQLPPPGPCEILFIDVAKTLDLNKHLVKHYFPRLIPSVSLVIQQDFYHAWHPYIHVTMELLSDYLVVEDKWVKSQSRLYRCVAPIPQKLIQELSEYSYSVDFLMNTIESAMSKETGPMRWMMEAVKAWQLVLLQRYDEAMDYIATLMQRVDFDKQQLWGQQLLRIEEVYKSKTKK